MHAVKSLMVLPWKRQGILRLPKPPFERMQKECEARFKARQAQAAAIPSQSVLVRFDSTKTGLTKVAPPLPFLGKYGSTPSGDIRRWKEDKERKRVVYAAWKEAKAKSLQGLVQAAALCQQQTYDNSVPAASPPAIAKSRHKKCPATGTRKNCSVPAASPPAVGKSRHKKCSATGKRKNCCTCDDCFSTAKALCVHKKQKHVCKVCKGVSLCVHNKVRYRCVACKGSGI